MALQHLMGADSGVYRNQCKRSHNAPIGSWLGMRSSPATARSEWPTTTPRDDYIAPNGVLTQVQINWWSQNAPIGSGLGMR